jgi:pyrrolidone-carboxylate peptidase
MSSIERTKQTIIKASELHRATSDVLKRAVNHKEHIIVESDGYKLAVVLSYPEYEDLIRQRALDTHRDLVIALGQEADRQGLTEERLAAELEEDKRQVFQERYGRKPAAKR